MDTSRKVNLDDLAAELRAAGFSTEVVVIPYVNERRLTSAGITVSPGGRVWFEHAVVVDWTALDIIRRHLSPPAQRFTEAEPCDCAYQLPCELHPNAMLDAVPPTVDVDHVMALVRSYGNARDKSSEEREYGNHEESGRWQKSADEYFAEIRAALEGTR